MSRNSVEVTTVSLGELLETATPVPRRSVFQRIFRGLGGILSTLAIVGVLGSIFAIPPLFGLAAATFVSEPVVETWRELPTEVGQVAIAERSYLYDKDGKVFATLWSENRIALDSLDEVSPVLVDALIATEDKRFFSHKGFDVIGTARAAVTRSGGGSGITQQLIKNLQFFNLYSEEDEKDAAVEASLMRKLRELKLAIYYERTASKEEILLEYFNTVAVGGPTIYGIETASQYFFEKSALDVSLAEAAALVGSMNNPSYYNLTDPDATEWKERQRMVLDRMVEEGFVTEEEATEAKEEVLEFSYKKLPGSCNDSSSPFYCEAVLDELKNSPRLGDTQEQREVALFRGGLHVHTYLDSESSKEANEYLSKTLGDDNRVVAPTAVVEPDTGGILVMAQNRKWGEGEGKTYIDLPLNPAGTGSTFKMVTLAAAIDAGIDIDSLKIVPRCPFNDPSLELPPGGVKNSGYCPVPKAIDFREATAISSNTWYLELAVRVGIDKVIEMANKLGLENNEGMTYRSGSFPLGVTEESPVQMAASYATFVNEGIYCPPRTISSISYENGEPVPVPDNFDPSVNACQRVISPYTSSKVLQAMKSVVDGSFPDSTGKNFNIGPQVVAKTGTNNLMNTTWVQLSRDLSLFTNVYDMDEPLAGIENIWYKDGWWNWKDHPSADIGTSIMRMMVAKSEKRPLNFNATDRSISLIPVEKREFITVPSVIGMTPDAAVATLKELGFIVNVEKKKVWVSDVRFPPGAIAMQSIEGGERIPAGVSKEIILTIGE